MVLGDQAGLLLISLLLILHLDSRLLHLLQRTHWFIFRSMMLKRDVVNALGECQANRSEEVTSLLVGILQIKFGWGTFLDALVSYLSILATHPQLSKSLFCSCLLSLST